MFSMRLLCFSITLTFFTFICVVRASSSSMQQPSIDGVMAASAVADNTETDNAKDIQQESRSDGEYRTCVLRYQLKAETIIRTQDSRALGAKYINETELPTQEDCLLWCCQTDACNVAIFEKKTRGSCYLFDCGSPTDFKCKFASHHLYTSAILDMSALEHDPGYSSHLHQSPAQPPFDEHMTALKNLKHQIQSEVPSTIRPVLAEISTEKPTASVTLPPVAAAAGGGGQVEAKTVTPASPNGEQHQSNSEKGTVRCSHFQFQCRTSKECIAVYNACDGIPQCADGSDESEELGCPTEGRRFGSNLEPASSSIVQGSILKPAKTSASNENSKRPNIASNDHELDHQITNHRQQTNVEKQFASSNSFGRTNSKVIGTNQAEEPMKYQYNMAGGAESNYQPSEINKQQTWQTMNNVNRQNSHSASSDPKQQPRPINLGYARSNADQNTGQLRPHQVTNERTHYNNAGHSYSRMDQADFDQEPIKSHLNNIYEEETVSGVKDQHLYNQPVQPYNENEGNEQSSYDNHHYDGPNVPPRNSYMREYYEGAGGPYQNHYKINNNNNSPPIHQTMQDNEEVFNHNKAAIKETNGGGWTSNSNGYVSQQQQAMYEGRGRPNAESGGYQFAEAEISPAHVHVETHQQGESIPQNIPPRRLNKVSMADKHADMYSNGNSDNGETVMNQISPGNGQENWSQNQKTSAQSNYQSVQQMHPVEQKMVPVVTTTTTTAPKSTTHQSTVSTPSPTPVKAHNKVSSAGVAVKSLARVHELEISEVDAVHAQRSSESSGAIVALTLGLSITGLLLVLVGCRLRMVRRRLRKGRAYAHDADYLVNGMYL
ncbi:hypothetical protein CHUAL_004209 [Chamberlinius hualienensis]